MSPTDLAGLGMLLLLLGLVACTAGGVLIAAAHKDSMGVTFLVLLQLALTVFVGFAGLAKLGVK